MFFSYMICFPLIFITAAHWLDTPSLGPSIKFLNTSGTADVVQLVNQTVDDMICDGKKWGYDLIKASCAEALEKNSC